MANIFEPTDEQVAAYQSWVAERPENVRRVAERFTPWGLYRLKPTNQRVQVLSFGEQEDGVVTLTVSVTGEFNFTMFDRQVFGIDPDMLAPCELPAEDEALGSMMSDEEVEASMPALRELAARGWKHEGND